MAITMNEADVLSSAGVQSVERPPRVAVYWNDHPANVTLALSQLQHEIVPPSWCQSCLLNRRQAWVQQIGDADASVQQNVSKAVGRKLTKSNPWIQEQRTAMVSISTFFTMRAMPVGPI